MGAQGKIGEVSHPDAAEPERADPAAGQQQPPVSPASHPGPRYQQPYPAQPYPTQPYPTERFPAAGGPPAYGGQPYGQPFPAPGAGPLPAA
ncbi:MAG: hypothetical protein JWR20_2687, partial [Marmoricola sp.]|nr:hypothetical protein [Marmoricola sp.]